MRTFRGLLLANIKARSRWNLPKSLDCTLCLIYGSLIVSLFLILSMAVVLILNGAPALFNDETSLFSYDWHPARGKFGIFPMLYGSFVVALIAICFAAPLGILSAIAVFEYVPAGPRILVKGMLELLAGIPSIIYGLIGIAILAPSIAVIFDLQSGRTILAAGLLLGVMILPTIITLSEDAFSNIPKHYRETAIGLGLYRYEVIKNVLFPIAKPDIVSAVLLALGRALGETMAVMLVIGSIDRIPNPWTNILSPAQTITSKIGREISESAFGSPHFQALILIAIILVLAGLVLSISAQMLTQKEQRLAD